jgi:hypothetical protein
MEDPWLSGPWVLLFPKSASRYLSIWKLSSLSPSIHPIQHDCTNALSQAREAMQLNEQKDHSA